MDAEAKKDIEECLWALKKGGTILYPTDTIWGIGCDATNPGAVKKIYSLKKRNDKKSLIILVADENEIENYANYPDPAVIEYIRNVQRPTTVIYPEAHNLPPELIAEDGSIAIRVCRNPFCSDLIRQLKKPLVSTSANLSGETPPENFKSISDEIRKGVDYVVQYRQDDDQIALPSMLIKWEHGSPVILRN